MTSLPPLSPEMADLLESLCLEELSPADATRLEDLVCSDVQCCRQYILFMEMHALVERFGGEGRGAWDEERGMAGSPAIDVSVVGVEVEHPAVAAVELPQQLDPESQIPEPPFPTLSTTNYPLPATPFVGSWAFS
ncbi:MAG: hypothetical protein K8R46_03480, partial [Pirellulales bacterium]|nr:hypothetical protein [Pirellulales bacterium]